MSREAKIGRDYEIDYLDAADTILTVKERFAQLLRPEEWQKKAGNIEGFADYVIDGFKGRESDLAFDHINDPLITPPSKNYYGRFGLVRVSERTTDFDFVSSDSGEIIIPGKTNVAEINIPKIHFPNDRKVAVPPEIVTKSFKLMANYFMAADAKPLFIMGLTHPRLGRLAAERWNFQMETHPFPPEVYELIEFGIREAKANPEFAWGLSSSLAVRDQVLVYQTREDFIKRASLQDTAMYEANKPAEQAQAKPELVTWSKRATSVSPEERAKVTQVLQYMQEGLGKAGVLDDVLRIEFYQSNKDGENPCLVLLKKASVDSLGPGEGPSIIENIHALERKTWQQFHPLPWRFALMLEGSRLLPLLSEHFFGTERMPKPLAVASGE